MLFLSVWLGANVEVAVHRARLVLRWVTVRGNTVLIFI